VQKNSSAHLCKSIEKQMLYAPKSQEKTRKKQKTRPLRYKQLHLNPDKTPAEQAAYSGVIHGVIQSHPVN